MGTVDQRIHSPRLAIFILLVISAMLFAITVVNVSRADQVADFSTSTFSAESATTLAGERVRYSLVIYNSGNASGPISVTTTLPDEMVYQTETFLAAANVGVVEDGRTVADNTLMWRGRIAHGQTLTLTVAARVNADVDSNVAVIHEATLMHDGEAQLLSAETNLLGNPQTTLFLPIVTAPESDIMLTATSPQPQGDFYAWDISWSADTYPDDARFTLEESHDPTFKQGVTRYMTDARSRTIVHAADTENVFYYRIVPLDGTPPSNVVELISAYRDDFSAETSWMTRREDLDDTNNELSYTDDELKLWVRGRWDYMIASPLAPAPEPPYRIETRVKFDGPASRNTYGIVFGGDWNGDDCFPDLDHEKPSNKSCLNHYYRAMMLWYTGAESMKLNLKRIDGHSKENSGRGDVVLHQWGNKKISNSANDWNIWQIEVFPDGTIRILNDGRLLVEKVDKRWINDPYWGFWASTDAHLGSDPLFDYVLVEPIKQTR